jgi:PPOX class probable F420-dependent enzyme
MDEALIRQRASSARVAHLATVRADGRPHVVACCFALDGDRAYTAVDDVKPKRTLELRRLDNIRHHSSATLLVDHYDDDWSALWWIRMEGDADIAEPGSPAHDVGVRLLAGKYEPYRDRPPPGTMIVIRIDAWRAWP